MPENIEYVSINMNTGKRILLSIVCACLWACAFSKDFRIMSFNMKGRRSAAMLAQTAEVIRDSDVSLVFLQEVYIKSKTPPALNALVSALGKNRWRYLHTYSYSLKDIVERDGETYKTCGTTQNNAVLYDSSVVEASDLAGELGIAGFDGEYLVDKNNVQIIRFSVKDGGLRGSGTEESNSFIGVNVHLPYNDGEHRERDLKTLERFFARYKHSCGVLIAGDFNTRRKDLSVRNFDYVDGADGWYYDRKFGLKTTLSTKGTDSVLFAQDYDHFVFSSKVRVVKPLRRFFSSSRKASVVAVPYGSVIYTSSVAYRKDISDHIPVVIDIEL